MRSSPSIPVKDTSPGQDNQASGSSRADMLGQERILPLLAKMAVPATIAMGVTALYNVVDTIFIGRGVGPLAIGGLSIAFPIQMLVLSIALMIGIGTASIVSRALGSSDTERAARAVGTGFTTLMVLAAVLVTAGILAADQLLVLFGATPDLLPFAREYLVTVIPGAPFIAGAVAANHIVRSEGRARYSMTIVVTGALLNIGLDALFILVLDMGIRGAALATVLAQFVSFVLALRFYVFRKSSLGMKLRYLLPDSTLLGEMLSLGVPAFIRQFGAVFFVIITNNALRTYAGDLSIAAFGVIMRVLTFSFMPLIGIAHGFQPIVGYNFGARNFGRVYEAVRKTQIVEFIVSMVPFALVMLFPRAVFTIFTTDPELVEIGQRAIRITLLAVPLIGLQIVGAVYFQAVGKPIPALVLSMSRQIILLIPLVLLLPLVFGVTGVWAAFPAADAGATAITLIWLAAAMKRLPRDVGSPVASQGHKPVPNPGKTTA